MARRTLICFIMVIFLAVAVSGCGTEQANVSLSIWTSADEQEIMKEMIESFQEHYEKEAQFEITISEEDEKTCRDTVLADPAGAADLYSFASDQFDNLQRENALLPITDDTEQIISDNGGPDSAAVLSSSKDGTLYAYPMVASNGYFMYYNTAYFTENDITSFDRMLDIAAENGKKVAMDFTSGWYIYSFFKGAGLDVEMNEDRVTNSCNWNDRSSSYTGVDVANAMLAIAGHDGFLNCTDENFVNGVKDGTIIAGINGAWNSGNVEEAFKENYNAAKLPTFTLAGNQVQMHSFAGYKLLGINAHTKNPEWAMRLAAWLTNEENQLTRFRKRGEGPSNVKAAASEEVQAAPAIKALSEQSAYSHLQNVAETFWTPTFKFGTTIAGGNRDKADIQKLLDVMTEGITSATEK
ncbi:MAG: extracellular solute-binding protein [Eubacterium sp.]|nr:extracellular solute-binding protein [Eubacterium sp.]